MFQVVAETDWDEVSVGPVCPTITAAAEAWASQEARNRYWSDGNPDKEETWEAIEQLSEVGQSLYISSIYTTLTIVETPNANPS